MRRTSALTILSTLLAVSAHAQGVPSSGLTYRSFVNATDPGASITLPYRFTPIPTGKRLIVTNGSCRVSIANSQQLFYVRLSSGASDAPSVYGEIRVPATATGEQHISFEPGAIFRAGETPTAEFLVGGNGQIRFMYGCTLQGYLLPDK